MKVRNCDIQALKSIASKAKINIDLINDVIHLFLTRKIERFATANKIIKGLSSNGHYTQITSIDKVNYYKNIYVSRTEKYSNKDSIVKKEINSYIKYKISTTNNTQNKPKNNTDFILPNEVQSLIKSFLIEDTNTPFNDDVEKITIKKCKCSTYVRRYRKRWPKHFSNK